MNNSSVLSDSSDNVKENSRKRKKHKNRKKQKRRKKALSSSSSSSDEDSDFATKQQPYEKTTRSWEKHLKPKDPKTKQKTIKQVKGQDSMLNYMKKKKPTAFLPSDGKPAQRIIHSNNSDDKKPSRAFIPPRYVSLFLCCCKL